MGAEEIANYGSKNEQQDASQFCTLSSGHASRASHTNLSLFTNRIYLVGGWLSSSGWPLGM